MNGFIKLTGYDNGLPAYIKADNIDAIIQRDEGTYVYTVATSVPGWFRESPEEIIKLIAAERR